MSNHTVQIQIYSPYTIMQSQYRYTVIFQVPNTNFKLLLQITKSACSAQQLTPAQVCLPSPSSPPSLSCSQSLHPLPPFLGGSAAYARRLLGTMPSRARPLRQTATPHRTVPLHVALPRRATPQPVPRRASPGAASSSPPVRHPTTNPAGLVTASLLHRAPKSPTPSSKQQQHNESSPHRISAKPNLERKMGERIHSVKLTLYSFPFVDFDIRALLPPSITSTTLLLALCRLQTGVSHVHATASPLPPCPATVPLPSPRREATTSPFALAREATSVHSDLRLFHRHHCLCAFPPLPCRRSWPSPHTARPAPRERRPTELPGRRLLLP